MTDRTQRRVVCAALWKTPNLVIGPRHFDLVMHRQIEAMNLGVTMRNATQGFIDQWGVFMDREEALQVAHEAQQILGVKCTPFNELFSEDLY